MSLARYSAIAKLHEDSRFSLNALMIAICYLIHIQANLRLYSIQLPLKAIIKLANFGKRLNNFSFALKSSIKLKFIHIHNVSKWPGNDVAHRQY